MDFELMFTSFPKLLGATVVTLKLLTVSLFFGIFIGLLFAILRLNKNIFINKFAYGYSYVFRGTPLLVQIFIIYFDCLKAVSLINLIIYLWSSSESFGWIGMLIAFE